MSGNVLSVPTELLRTELQTKILFMEAMIPAVPVSEAADRFFRGLLEAKIPVPNYGRSCSTWGEFLEDSVEDGFVTANGAVALSPRGQSHLRSLHQALKEVP